MTTQSMKKGLMTLATLGIAAVPAHAQQVLSYYDFGSQTSGTAAPTTFTPQGIGTLTINGFTSGAAATNNVVFFAGSTVNAQPNDTAGSAVAVLGGTATGGNNGGTILITENTTGFKGEVLSFATQGTSTGFKNNVFAYSTDGGATFTDFATYSPPTAFALQTFDLSSIATLDNNAAAQFRITFNGSSSASGNNRIDNLTITGNPVAAAPEPSGIVAMLIGMGALGLVAARRRTQAA